MKLSETQLAILRQMGEGDVLCTKWPWGYRWDGDPREAKGMRSDSVWKLWRVGFVRDNHTSLMGASKFSITPAGRAYLEGLE